ncbi:hypothetical protein Patl1_01261 [Pistacia atlantica]|uniref:Uncharacterized protein n=1 Tax=Pistacia atlantica TaxID=434234 RepID=A0ACC1C485_9ROSI|nr:hypothetical protein Patl1_01261 [Pistacia atlantica]
MEGNTDCSNLSKMPRRRLRINCSSDSEQEEEPNQPQTTHFYQNNQQTNTTHPPVNLSPSTPNPNPNTNQNPNPNPYPPDPLPISDEDDEIDSFTEPPTTAPENSPIADMLLTLGLRLKRDWLYSCVQGLKSSVSGFSNLDVSAKAKLCFQQFLFSDMNYCGAGVLPNNVDSLHLVDLKGPFVLQVDEIVNISCPLRGRFQDTASGIKRCLKLSMTDGAQRVFGMEYRPIKDLKVLAPAGLKVVICNVHIRHGLLMLVPEALEVLGGMVQQLEVARQHLVEEVNKPPRGKRTRTGVVPSLATRATLAAWPSNGFNVTGQTNSSISENATSFQANEQAWQTNGSTSHNATSFRANEQDWQANSSAAQNATSFQANEQGAPVVSSGTAINQRSTTVPINGVAVANSSSGVVVDFEEMHIDAVPTSRVNTLSNSNYDFVFDVEDFNMVHDVNKVEEVEHPLILSGEREIPFTYLASLSAKWAAMKEKTPSVQGKIKCFLTGVKRFQYKGRERYELLVYVDDGSLISEILIDHNVVQNGIGYSPAEVTAALSSSDTKTVSDMKETFRQFQLLLVNFEGTMLVEMNETSPRPIVLEMTQGCPSSDARLLLRRLKPPPARAQTPPCPFMNPIEISP